MQNNGGFVNFKDIIGYICNTCELLEGFYWTRSKKVGNTILLPNHLAVSESNWSYSDVEENLKLNEILEEICKYLGFTCMQWGARMYFIDYQYLHDHNDIYATWYGKASDYREGAAAHLDGAYTVTAEDYRNNDANISFMPVYNKAKVISNFKSAEGIISKHSI